MVAADTVAAIATAPGRGAIGVIRVSGPGVLRIMQGIIGRVLPPRNACLAKFLDASGEAIDEGIALHFPAPRSYTGEDVLELQGHGGPAVLRLLLKRCLDLGARVAEPGEFTRRAFLNDKLDLAQAEAVADLIDASTEQAARSAARSLQGAFSRMVAELQRQLTDLRVLIEATLDFPEDEINVLRDTDAANRLERLRTAVLAGLRSATQGILLRDGVTIALIGPTNSGKSSIINILSGDEVAIVSSVPGTTRDLIRQTVELRGVPVHIVDTAGLRQAVDVVEAIGIARTRDAISKADLVLLVADVAADQDTAVAVIATELPVQLRTIYVHNKIDLTGEAPHVCVVAGRDHVWISAKLGLGIDQLIDTLLRNCGCEDRTEGAFLARERHVRALRECESRLQRAAASLAQVELAADELRGAQTALSLLTGEFVADDLLGEIFSRFCIGK